MKPSRWAGIYQTPTFPFVGVETIQKPPSFNVGLMSVNALSLISLGESDKTLWSDKSINRSFFELSGKGAHKKADSYEISPQSKFWLGVQVLSSPTLSLSTLTYYTPVILNYL